MIGHEKDIPSKQMVSDTVKNASIKVLIGPQEGWDSHVMRIVELETMGYSPEHSHPWPHINYILEGEGVLMMEGVDHPVSMGSIAYVPSDTHHQFKNSGGGVFKFMCIVPVEGHQ